MATKVKIGGKDCLPVLQQYNVCSKEQVSLSHSSQKEGTDEKGKCIHSNVYVKIRLELIDGDGSRRNNGLISSVGKEKREGARTMGSPLSFSTLGH